MSLLTETFDSLNWESIKLKHKECENLIIDPNLDNNRRVEVQKLYSFLNELLENKNSYYELTAKLKRAQDELALAPDLADLYQEEISELSASVAEIQNQLQDLIYPSADQEYSSLFLEIRAGTGGQEAALFAGDLLKLYLNYSLKRGWKVSVADASETDLKGYREVILHIQGKTAYSELKKESGVHRVQRVPATETAGRIHTSTVTVAVLPEEEEATVDINPSDLRIDVFRASGAGGQHVNTTDSAVRITHLPTGVVVSCQDERSQHKNKAKALAMLRSKIVSEEKSKKQQLLSSQRKEQVGSGERSEKVRTYNYPQNRITDHQVDLTLKKLDIVMEGNLEEIVEALIIHDRTVRQKNPLLSGFEK
jgi:peptide chain release factor 1